MNLFPHEKRKKILTKIRTYDKIYSRENVNSEYRILLKG